LKISVKKTPKVKALLETAKTLFYKYGFKRVTVEEICTTAEVSKVTFYKNFKNKDELFAFIVTEMYQEGMHQYTKIMNSNITFKEKIEKFIDMKKYYAEAMSVEMMRDMYSHASPEVRDVMNELFAQSMEMNRQFFLKARKEGDLRHDANIDFIMFFINKMMDWMDNDDLLNLFDTPKDMAVEMVNFLFYGMAGRAKDQS